MSKDAEGKKLYAELGGKSLPFITIGKQQMNGFNQEQLEEMLKTAGINQP